MRKTLGRAGVGLVVVIILSATPGVRAQGVIGPCIQFTHNGEVLTNLLCDFSANSLEVGFVGDSSVQFSKDGSDAGTLQTRPKGASSFKATFSGGVITGFTWLHGKKSLGNATVPEGANDFHFAAEHGIHRAVFTTDEKESSKARPPVGTNDVELFLVPQPT
jgi:hypothetical protein